MSERLTTFLKTVTDFANAECEELKTRAQSFRDDNITAYRKEAEAKSRSHAEYEINRILSRTNCEISDYEGKRKAALTHLRTEITDKIFGEVCEKIKEFTRSADYEQFLLNSASSLKNAIGAETIIFFLKPDDMKYADRIKEDVPGCTVREDNDILLGGLRATDGNAQLCGDDTLDIRLTAQRELFAEKSDLKIY